MIKNGEVSLVVNTVEEKRSAVSDSRSIRTSALQRACDLLHHCGGRPGSLRGHAAHEILVPYPLQELHAGLRPRGPIAKWLGKSGHISSLSTNSSVLNNRCRCHGALGAPRRLIL